MVEVVDAAMLSLPLARAGTLAPLIDATTSSSGASQGHVAQALPLGLPGDKSEVASARSVSFGGNDAQGQLYLFVWIKPRHTSFSLSNSAMSFY